MRSVSRSILLLAVVVLGLAACDREPSATEEPSAASPSAPGATEGAAPAGGGRPLLQPEPTPGVYFRVRNAEPAAAAEAAGPRTVEGEALSDEEVARRFRILPDLPATAELTTTFALLPGPRPPAIPGEARQQPWPPPASEAPPPEVPTGPLTVTRAGPEGDVPMAARMAVTFSDAMVPLTSHAALAARDLPVDLSPEVEGQWRWVGTKTLLFEPEFRFPQATEYRAQVPVGTTSENELALAAAYEWTFRTPPAELIGFQPGVPRGRGPIPTTDRHPVLFAYFDQEVEPEAVLGVTRAVAGEEPVELRLATPAEIEADDTAAAARERATAGRWAAFRSVDPLPLDTQVAVTIGPELPSAEGPRTSGDQSWTYVFNVYGPLAVRNLHCSQPSGDGPDHLAAYGAPYPEPTGAQITIDHCYPGEGWGIVFNNELDTKGFEDLEFTIEPAIPGIRFEPQGSRVAIRGLSEARTQYVVTVPEEVTDIYGQTLGRDTEVVFNTGEARPTLVVPGQQMLIVDPVAEGTLDLITRNVDALHVRLYRVEPTLWPAYVDYLEEFSRWLYGHRRGSEELAPAEPAPPGEKVLDEQMTPAGSPDEFTLTDLDLSPALTQSSGHAIALIVPPGWREQENERVMPQVRWVQVTDLGINAARDSEMWQVWVTRLRDAEPLAGSEVELAATDTTATTDREGLATLPIAPSRDQRMPYLTARLGEDEALLPLSSGSIAYRASGYSYADFYDPEERTRLIWYVFDDRGIYRPGEKVHLKGWVRPMDWGKGGDLEPADPELERIGYRFVAPNGEDIAARTVEVTAAGGFDEAFIIPRDVELGLAHVYLSPEGKWAGQSTSHAIQIAEFRRPEYEVEVQAEAPDYFVGDTAYVEATASYFAGGPLAGAEITWRVVGEPTDYSPPGHPDFIFGRRPPIWFPYPARFGGAYGSGSEVGRETLESLTDAEGEHRLAIDLDNVVPLSAASISAEATVMDVNRQAWSAETSLMVHPASEYVGLRLSEWFVDPGETLEIDAIVADLDGELVVGRDVTICAERLEWVFEAGEYSEEPVPAGQCSLSSADRPVICELEFDEGGRYRLTADVTDSQGRMNTTLATIWVTGGEPAPTGERAAADEVELIPNASQYQPGDTAEILVQAPFSPAEGLMTVRRSGLVSTQRFRMAGGSHTLRLPITEAEMPGCTVNVKLVGTEPRGGPGVESAPDLPAAPAFAVGSVELKVPPLQRTLSVDAAARADRLEPGESTVVDVTVVGPGGEPIADAEVAVVVADEAIIALTGYEIPDPIEIFYPERPEGVADARNHGFLWLVDPEALAEDPAIFPALSRAEEGLPPELGGGGGFGMAMDMAVPRGLGEEMAEGQMWLGYAPMPPPPTGGGPPAEEPQVRLRTNLNPLALFAPALTTDDSGRASVELTLPDNVTRYRITAVATDGAKSFGKGESSLTAALPLAVRPSAPRFLNFGDAFELPIVVQNQTDEPLQTDVIVRAANLELEGGAEGVGRRVSVPANDRIEVRFPGAAAMPGTVVFQAAALSGSLGDAQMVDLPTWTPATTEAFATYGEIDEGAVAQPVERPPDAVEDFGGLETTITSTALGNLTDAYLYLKEFPFESSEAIASRLVATVALKDGPASFEPEGQPRAAEVVAGIDRDLRKLATRQNYDGGFGWWRRYRPDCGSPPFLSVHVIHTLARAMLAGYEPSPEMIGQAQSYLRNIDGRLDACGYSGEARNTTEAYAIYTMSLLGEAQPGQAVDVLERSGEREVEAMGWLLMTLSAAGGFDDAKAEIHRQLGNRASEEAATAQFTGRYEEGQGHVVLASDRRSDAVALEALIVDTPDSTLIPKLARGLLDHRVKGRWASTQENAWVLLALNRYFQTYEAEEPDFVARTWLGDGFIGATEFAGRSADRAETLVPLTYLSPEPTDIILAKDGPGRLYYRLGLRYAPEELELEPLERGFSVSRVYDWVDDPADVKRLADGTYEVRAGARVRVRLAMVADTRRYHVALVDPLPAGLEALNPELAVTGDIPPDVPRDETGTSGAEYRWWWPWPWYDHQEFRDERTEAFTNLLYPGVYSFTYVARATTPGSFVVPPTKAEELYHPETFGRGGTDRVVVK